MSVNELARNEIINPMITNVVMLFIFALNDIMTSNTAVAPANAAMLTPIVDHQVNDDAAAPVSAPVNNITTPTPKLAPLLIPNIDGSASGLRNNVCINNPATDNAAPANKAVIACGNL